MAEISVIRILYMEDDPGLCLLLKKNLQRRGFIVDTAFNGEEGIRMAESGCYDALLVDYNMPFFGGIDVLRAIAALNLTTPVVMVTGQGNEAVAVEALKLGASDYVVKDVEMRYLDLLPAVIDQVLYKQQLLKERDQILEAVRDSEERYRRLVELVPDGIGVHIGEVFVFMNPAGASLLGASGPDRVIGNSVWDVVQNDFREIEKSRILQLKKGTDTVVLPWIEEKFVRMDGSVIDVETVSLNLSYNGQPAVQTIFRDITERKMTEQRVAHSALYDALTGLPNRTLCFDRMKQALETAKRSNCAMALLCMDLDRFKLVNDMHGHETGDLVLQEAARRILSCIRKTDTLGRMGGDEFLGICGNITRPGDVFLVADKIIEVLSSTFCLNGATCSIGVSIGISMYPADGDHVEMMLTKAEHGLHRVKQTGNGGYIVSNE